MTRESDPSECQDVSIYNDFEVFVYSLELLSRFVQAKESAPIREHSAERNNPQYDTGHLETDFIDFWSAPASAFDEFLLDLSVVESEQFPRILKTSCAIRGKVYLQHLNFVMESFKRIWKKWLIYHYRTSVMIDCQWKPAGATSTARECQRTFLTAATKTSWLV